MHPGFESTDPVVQELLDLLRRGRLSAAFQPILDFQAQRYMGYEGLIRGPADSPLCMPAAMFAAARAGRIEQDFEHACREVVLQDFATLRLAGRLFVNLSAPSLEDTYFLEDGMHRSLSALGLRPERVVIEITENEKVADFSIFRETLARLRGLGYRFAIDDLGEGFSNLRMWSEIRPEFVKIDRHFISGIAEDPLKCCFVRAMQEVAEACNASLIAEGIEHEADFATVRDLGIEFGQGFLIARPERQPAADPSGPVRQLLAARHIVVFPRGLPPGGLAPTVGELLGEIRPVAPEHDNDAVYRRFEADEDLQVLPVVDGGTPLGMINRHTLIDRFARPFRRELYGKRPCTQFMNPQSLVVERTTTVQEVARLLGEAPRHHMLDGFIITENGRYAGVGSTQDLISRITELQIRSARYANPLTQLPGNVPINEHIDRLLAEGAPFAACYCDIDHFKPYNDAYGYRRGDDMIQILAALLVHECDPRLDFVGHVGGDDFIVLMQSADWEERCARILREFDRRKLACLESRDVASGGLSGEDRRGQPTFHPLPTLSIGCLPVDAQAYESHQQVAAAVADTKKQAKKLPGSALFIERRRHATMPLQIVPRA